MNRITQWQDDFVTWAVGYVYGLRYERFLPFLAYKAKFPISRMVGPGFCWISASTYKLRVRDGGVLKDALGKPILDENGNEILMPFYKDIATIYNRSISDAIRSTACGSAEMAAKLSEKNPGETFKRGEIEGYAYGPDGRPSVLQAALAVINIPALQELEVHVAWRAFMSRNVKPDYSVEPHWAIVP